MSNTPVPSVMRMVLYVLPTHSKRAGEIRPATIVRVNVAEGPYASVNLHVFLDGPNDFGEVDWQGTVHHDQDSKRPGTWHWNEHQVVTGEPSH